GKTQTPIKQLSWLDLRTKPPPKPAVVTPAKKLASFIILAAPRSASQSPDVAIGLALGSHLVREGRTVSLVVVPRDPLADKKAEELLRKHEELVQDGIVIGESGILSDDSRTLLRQVLTGPSRPSILGALQTTLGAIETLILAILALLGLKAVAPVAADLGTRFIQRGEYARNQSASGWRGWWPTVRSVLRPKGGDVEKDPWRVRFKEERVTVWLRSGGSIQGKLRGESPDGLLELTDVTLADYGDERDRRVATTLVRVEDITLIAQTPEDRKDYEATPVRRASLRLVAEMLAGITRQDLTELRKDALRKAVRETRAELEGEADEAKDARKRLTEVPNHDLQELVDEAQATSDTELHAALRGLVDGHKLARGWSEDRVARTALFDALGKVVDVATARRTAVSARPAERPAH